METIKGKVTWIDIENPSPEELEWLQDSMKCHPVIIEELKQPSARTRVERFGDYIYLVYQFPIYDSREKVSRRGEIDLLIYKQHVVTVHYEPLEPLSIFRTSVENPDFKAKVLQDTLQLSYHLIGSFLDFNQRQLRHIQEKVEEAGLQLFSNKERHLLEQISYLKRDLSEYRVIISPQEHLLRSFAENGIAFWGSNARIYLNDLLGDYLKVMNSIEDYRQAVADFEATNVQLMNMKTTEVLKTFTILSFLTFPFMLFATIFSMNTSYTPIVEGPYGFWIIVGIIVAGMLTHITYFKKKGWL